MRAKIRDLKVARVDDDFQSLASVLRELLGTPPRRRDAFVRVGLCVAR